jgi:hypothetical protein
MTNDVLGCKDKAFLQKKGPLSILAQKMILDEN